MLSTPTLKTLHPPWREFLSDSTLNASHDFCITMDTQLKKTMTDAVPATDDLNKKLFDEEGQTVTDLTNTARNYIWTAIEKRKDVKTFSGDHYETAKNNTAASIATSVPAMIQDNKIMLTSFVTSSSRTTDKQQELIKLLIQTINMNCKWL